MLFDGGGKMEKGTPETQKPGPPIRMRDRSRQFRASVLSLSFREVRRAPFWSFKTFDTGGDPFRSPFPRVVGSFGHLGRGPKSHPTASTSGICAVLEGRRPSGLKGFERPFCRLSSFEISFGLYGFLPPAWIPLPGNPPLVPFHPALETMTARGALEFSVGRMERDPFRAPQPF